MNGFPVQSQYDPLDNPRNPEIEDPEEAETRIAEEAITRGRLRALREQQAVFNSDGWTHIDRELATAEDALNTQLISGDSHDPQKDAFKRGQLKLIQHIREMPNQVSNEIHGITQVLPD